MEEEKTGSALLVNSWPLLKSNLRVRKGYLESAEIMKGTPAERSGLVIETQNVHIRILRNISNYYNRPAKFGAKREENAPNILQGKYNFTLKGSNQGLINKF